MDREVEKVAAKPTIQDESLLSCRSNTKISSPTRAPFLKSKPRLELPEPFGVGAEFGILPHDSIHVVEAKLRGTYVAPKTPAKNARPNTVGSASNLRRPEPTPPSKKSKTVNSTDPSKPRPIPQWKEDQKKQEKALKALQKEEAEKQILRKKQAEEEYKRWKDENEKKMKEKRRQLKESMGQAQALSEDEKKLREDFFAQTKQWKVDQQKMQLRISKMEEKRALRDVLSIRYRHNQPLNLAGGASMPSIPSRPSTVGGGSVRKNKPRSSKRKLKQKSLQAPDKSKGALEAFSCEKGPQDDNEGEDGNRSHPADELNRVESAMQREITLEDTKESAIRSATEVKTKINNSNNTKPKDKSAGRMPRKHASKNEKKRRERLVNIAYQDPRDHQSRN